MLGKGGMGAVYEAVQEGLGRTVALKVLDPSLATHPDQLERFRREATSAAALGHSNIVAVTDFGAPSGDEPPYLVMELLSGESLGSLLDREAVLAPERTAFIASQMLSALGAAHAAGIIHRDIKPDNVFLTSTSAFHDLVKVLDFGIAKLGSEQGASRLTGTGTMLGTPAYMAPEQARGATVDHRADLYAVGATMYQALSGRLPHDAPSFPAMLFAIVEQDPQPLARLRPDLPPGLVAIVDRAMAKKPENRFPSAEAMRAALAPFLPGSAGVTGPVSSDAPTIAAPASGATGSSQPTPVVVRSLPPSAEVRNPSVGGVAQTTPPPMAPSKSSAGVIAAAAVAIVAILGVVAVLIVRFSADARGAATPPAIPAPPSVAAANAVASALPSAAPGGALVAPSASAASVVAPPVADHPKVVPTASGSAPVASVVSSAVAAAPAPAPTAGKVYGGERGHRSSLDFSECLDCDWHAFSAAMEAEEPSISACYKASLHEPPVHEFPFYFVYLNGDGTVKDIEVRSPVTPNLDRCLGTILRRHPLSRTKSTQAMYKVGFTGECKTFECK
jgi:serine/threonine-protein kinase